MENVSECSFLSLEELKSTRALLTGKEVAAQLRLSDRTIAGLRSRGGGPVFVRISRTRVMYRQVDVDAWVQQRLRTSTSDRGAEA